MKVNFLTLFILSLALACNPGVVFEHANPPSIEASKVIPGQYRGNYICESDSAIVKIDSRRIIQEVLVEFVTTLEKVQETEHCSIVDGGLYLPGRKECIPFEYIGEDTISAILFEQDTLFDLTRDHVAKMYRKQLFLNVPSDSGEWMTWIVRTESDGTLLYSYIDVPDNKELIDELTVNYRESRLKRDKTQYILQPTLMEFEEIIKKDFVLFCDRLIPINAEFDYPVK